MRGEHVLILALCCAGWLPAAAQTIHRCGNSYSHVPCAGGSAVPTDEARDQAQEKARKAQADAATRRDMKLAAELEKSRLKEEAAQSRASRAAGRGPSGPDLDAEAYDDPRAEPKKKSPYFTARAAPAPKKKEDNDTPTEKAAEKKGAAPLRP